MIIGFILGVFVGVAGLFVAGYLMSGYVNNQYPPKHY